MNFIDFKRTMLKFINLCEVNNIRDIEQLEQILNVKTNEESNLEGFRRGEPLIITYSFGGFLEDWGETLEQSEYCWVHIALFSDLGVFLTEPNYYPKERCEIEWTAQTPSYIFVPWTDMLQAKYQYFTIEEFEEKIKIGIARSINHPRGI